MSEGILKMSEARTILRFVNWVGILCMGSFAMAMTVKHNSQLPIGIIIEQSDEIVVGKVIKQEPHVIRRSFETRYDIEVSESLKSTSGELKPGKTFTMTLPGAALTTPPITQYVSGVPYLGQNEEVLLFLKNSGRPVPEAAARDANSVSLYGSSPKIVGWNQGRFSIFTNPSTGNKVVTRVNFENYGLINSGDNMQGLQEAISQGSIKLTEQQIVRAADFAAEARDKDPLEVTGSDVNQFKVEEASQRAFTAQEMRQRGGIPAQDFEAFKQEIQSHINQGK